MSKNAIIGALSGENADFVRTIRTTTIHWKQGSFLGVGGDRSQTYRECLYKLNKGHITVFIQSDKDIPKPLKLNRRLQYGLNNGNMFLVLHDKEQTPYQHRYVMSDLQQITWVANEVLKKVKNVDLSWMAGDYLHDFE